MTLIAKFKSGKVTTFENVDDVYMENGRTLKCKTYRIKYFIMRYSTGEEYVTFPNKKH